jgi:hypothetical protein
VSDDFTHFFCQDFPIPPGAGPVGPGLFRWQLGNVPKAELPPWPDAWPMYVGAVLTESFESQCNDTTVTFQLVSGTRSPIDRKPTVHASSRALALPELTWSKGFVIKFCGLAMLESYIGLDALIAKGRFASGSLTAFITSDYAATSNEIRKRLRRERRRAAL